MGKKIAGVMIADTMLELVGPMREEFMKLVTMSPVNRRPGADRHRGFAG